MKPTYLEPGDVVIVPHRRLRRVGEARRRRGRRGGRGGRQRPLPGGIGEHAAADTNPGITPAHAQALGDGAPVAGADPDGAPASGDVAARQIEGQQRRHQQPEDARDPHDA